MRDTLVPVGRSPVATRSAPPLNQKLRDVKRSSCCTALNDEPVMRVELMAGLSYEWEDRCHHSLPVLTT